MRLKITLISNDKIVLPVGFNEIIQWFIYDSIKDEWLHNVGFNADKKNFKLFCFSGIYQRGKYLKDRGVFLFGNSISFVISSPVDWILEKLAAGSITKERVNFGRNEVEIGEISVLKQPKIENPVVEVKALTPIETHSTFEIEGKKKTHYYTPFEDDFARLINENARKKWLAFYRKEPPSELKIKPIGNNREKIVRFGTGRRYVIVKGWVGNFELTGDVELLKFIIDTGLGSRNSQGFGMVEVKK